MKVKIWQEKIKIPTYKMGQPEKYPIFLDKRVYQGSSGVVYPFPIIEKIYDEKEDKTWHAVFIENEFLKIMVLPELGGRIQMAYDKIKQRHFIYYNQVIKPALVGLAGPWISGGIEFNWPQHHRPSTFEPVDFFLEENTDGSKTIWVSEIERMSRTKGMAGFTLYPDTAYLEIKVHLYNRTPHPQTFLWWANPAVHVNDHYQSVFPPDVHAVFDHGKRDVSRFPIATGTYYKMDYSSGVDISRYKNIPVPTSYMAIQSKYNFVGGYEHDSKGGVLHVANHHVSPGKKQWTWGNGDFGKAWDRNLTDQDGPYIELMCGVYTDNQPDFSWLQPYEEKSFKQYFMPYGELGLVKEANKDAMLNLTVDAGKAILKIYSTGYFPECQISLETEDHIYLNETFDFKPGSVYETCVDVDENIPLEVFLVRVVKQDEKVLIHWKNEKTDPKPLPDPAIAALPPEEISTNELLYLNGLHLEQYRHATYDPTSYYREALKRDPGDIRNNNGLGLWLLRRGQFKEAEQYFQNAIHTLTLRNPNPYDSEPYYNLGVTLKFQEILDEAYAAFYKAVWNAAWQDAGYFQLATIDCARGEYEESLELVERSLVRNWHNHKARHLKVTLLRLLGKTKEASQFAEDSLKIDPFNMGIIYEKYLLSEDNQILEDLKTFMRQSEHHYIEISLDYANAGLYQEAYQILEIINQPSKNAYPMVHYFLGWYKVKTGDMDTGRSHINIANDLPTDFCFPNRLEEMIALKDVVQLIPNNAKAWHYLGNFYYAFKRYDDAIHCWEMTEKQDIRLAVNYRNLGLAYFNKRFQKEKALEKMEQAFKLDSKNSRLLFELDQLYKRFNRPYQERLTLLQGNLPLVEFRDDLFLELIGLHNYLDEFEKALQLLMKHQFHPWEGGEGKVPAQYIWCHLEIAKRAIYGEQYEKAIQHLKQAQVYPNNLGEGKLHGAQENDIFYWIGYANAGLGNKKEAAQWWEKTAEGLCDPSPAMFYNDQQPDKIFYQGLALMQLGKKADAKSRFQKLLDYGKQHISDDVKIDYFAVSLPDLLIWEKDLNLQNRLHCQYLIGLAYLGFGEIENAINQFDEILSVDRYHIGAVMHKNLAEQKMML